nr:L10-interacting MYB domain-containing protein-like [Tanacetum cinerariifolium]
MMRMLMEEKKEDDMGACIEKLDKIGWTAQDPMYDTALLLFGQSADYRKLWLHLKPESCGNRVKSVGRKKLKYLKKKSFDSIQKMFDRAFKMVNIFVDLRIELVKEFNREDLEDLYKLVKAKYGSTRPVEDLDLLLWGDLKTMFEPHVKD